MNIVSILQAGLGVIVLMFLHELGHVLFAKLLGLKVYKVGFQWSPYPHFFVAADWPKQQLKRLIYLFSGSLITVTLFFISYCVNWLENSAIYYAFAIQLIIELNPFYSDFTIAAVTSNEFEANMNKSYADLYKERFAHYQFSYRWYIHFALWVIFILMLVKNNINA